jgi:flagellar basal-body rod protein FlgG
MTQGTLAQTGNTLDVAIQGSGWFKIPDARRHDTRDGSFQMDNQGRIVTAEGNLVQPTITIPANSSGLTINSQGQVSVTLPGSTTSSILGQFTLTTFIKDAGLQANGNNLFVATPASGTPQDGTPGLNNAGTLLQGSLESSNVSAVTEITNLISAQRAYEMNSKVITAADQMLQTTAQLMR